VQDQVVNLLAARLDEFMTRYGYEKIETPIIQPAELFLTKAGDQIIHRLFTFERLGRQLALRPEFTALAAHTYVTQFAEDERPVVRWQFGGPVFEDASGDYQRYSIGAELIGLGGAAAEAEIIALAANGAAERGLERWNLVIGHAQLMRVLLERFKLDNRTQRFLLHHLPALKQPGKAYILEQLDKLLLGKSGQEELGVESVSELSTQQMLDVLLDATQHGATMGGRTRHDIVRRLLQKRQRATERTQVVAALDFLEAWSAISASPEVAFGLIESMITPDDAEARRVLNEWRSVITLLSAYDIPASRIQIQPALARNWDYYTGIVFELWSDDGHHIGGGGRYDELAHLVGGQRDVPAVGFAYYVDQLLAALPEASPAAQASIMISASSDNFPSAIQWAQRLRSRGQTVVLLEAEAADERAFSLQSDGSLRRGNQNYPTVESLIDTLETAR
jgi:histidyl-tRNA synthetase